MSNREMLNPNLALYQRLRRLDDSDDSASYGELGEVSFDSVRVGDAILTTVTTGAGMGTVVQLFAQNAVTLGPVVLICTL